MLPVLRRLEILQPKYMYDSPTLSAIGPSSEEGQPCGHFCHRHVPSPEHSSMIVLMISLHDCFSRSFHHSRSHPNFGSLCHRSLSYAIYIYYADMSISLGAHNLDKCKFNGFNAMYCHFQTMFQMTSV